MTSSYWQIVPIDFERNEGARRVLLYGERDEAVGPMTMERAAAWLTRFEDSRPPEAKLPRLALSRARNRIKKASQKQDSAGKRHEARELVN